MLKTFREKLKDNPDEEVRGIYEEISMLKSFMSDKPQIKELIDVCSTSILLFEKTNKGKYLDACMRFVENKISDWKLFSKVQYLNKYFEKRDMSEQALRIFFVEMENA